jgi:uncharacterized membrane protein
MNLQRAVEITLRTGAIVSSALVSFGLVLYFVEGETSLNTTANFSVLQTFQGLSKGDPVAIILVGVVVLVATPVIRIVELLIGYVEERDRMYVMMSLLVLVFMLVGIILLPVIR